MIARSALLILALTTSLQAKVFEFPTNNRALLENKPEDFYMYVDRDFEGTKSKAWEGGSFGYVRGPQRQDGEIIYMTLHEGIDIAPLRRDASGKPLDEIRASADGKVVHTSNEAGASNYGKYIVIEHEIEGSPIYTLYAHLSTISVHPGQRVKQRETIAQMGFTGAGINCERAHLHFEIALMWSANFEQWYDRYFKGTPNKHGLYHGYNLIGIDPATILIECAKNPSFKLSEHLRKQDAFYKITIPQTPDIIRNYPWLAIDGEDANPPGWTIAFNRNGAPVKATASLRPPANPLLDWVCETPLAYHHATRGIVGGSKGAPHLTDSGKRFAELLGGKL